MSLLWFQEKLYLSKISSSTLLTLITYKQFEVIEKPKENYIKIWETKLETTYYDYIPIENKAIKHFHAHFVLVTNSQPAKPEIWSGLMYDSVLCNRNNILYDLEIIVYAINIFCCTSTK